MRKIFCDKSGREILDPKDIITIKAVIQSPGVSQDHPKMRPIEVDAITFSRIREFLDTNTDWNLLKINREEETHVQASE